MGRLNDDDMINEILREVTTLDNIYKKPLVDMWSVGHSEWRHEGPKEAC